MKKQIAQFFIALLTWISSWEITHQNKQLYTNWFQKAWLFQTSKYLRFELTNWQAFLNSAVTKYVFEVENKLQNVNWFYTKYIEEKVGNYLIFMFSPPKTRQNASEMKLFTIILPFLSTNKEIVYFRFRKKTK